MAQKNMAIAIILSILLTGIGIVYAGNVKKGLTYFVLAVILNILGTWVFFIFAWLSTVVWAYALYQTYLEVNAVNGN